MRLIESTKQLLRNSQYFNFLVENIYLVLFSILIFLTPLVTVSGTNELYEFPKMFFVYIFGFFIIAFFFSDVLLHSTKLKRPSFVVLAFLVVIIISTILSSDPYTSVFGYYTRFNGGLISYLVYFGLYFVAINKFKKGDFTKLLKVALFTFIPICIIGISQYYGFRLIWPYMPVSRVFSTIGQPNWLAQYLAMLLPVCVYFSLAEKGNKSIIWVVLYCFGFYCFWLTFSLSGYLGLFVALIALVMFFSSKEVFDKHVALKIGILCVFSLVVIFVNMGIFKSKLNDAIYDVKRVLSTVGKVYAAGEGYQISDPGYIRSALWGTTFNLIKSSPKIFFIGTGPETYPYTYQPYRSLKLNYSSEWDFVFNKPHNYYLETWAESGVLAFALFIMLIFKSAFNSHYFVFPALVAFGITNVFGWPVVSTALLFWLLISYSEV